MDYAKYRCNHAGTHIDFPSHVIPNAKDSSQY
jgi:kynurenine formamidase